MKKKVIILMIVIICVLPLRWPYAVESYFLVDPEYKNNNETYSFEEMGIVYLTEEPRKKRVECLDINNQGFVALGLRDTNTNTAYVSIYSSEGVFQFSYQFKTAGTFYIELLDDRVNIFHVRGRGLISIPFDRSECERRKVLYNEKENDAYIRFLSSPEKKLDGTVYRIESGFPVLRNRVNLSRLLIVSPTGEGITVYDETKFLFFRMVGILLFWCAAVVIVIVGLIKLIRKTRKDYLEQLSKTRR